MRIGDCLNQFELISPGGRVKTVKEASQLTREPLNRIIKTVVLYSESLGGIAAIVTGDKTVDLEKLSSLLGVNLRQARPDEVRKLTGYPVGGVPPICHGLLTVVDYSVLDQEYVIGGGGDEFTLIKISPQDILAFNKALVANISKGV